MKKIQVWLILTVVLTLITLSYHYFIIKSETEIILRYNVQAFNTLKNLRLIGYGIIGFCVTCTFICFLKKAKENNTVEIQRKAEIKERQSDPVKQLLFEIDKYFESDETIDRIKDGLSAIKNSLPAIKRQYDNVNLLVGNRFDADSLSHKKFMAPVENLFQTMTKAVSDLIQKLKLFDEAECVRKIEKYNNSGYYNRVQEQEEILNNYFKYISDITNSIEEISVRFDKLILEIGKFSDEELNKSLSMLAELDNVISHTKLYQK